MTWPTDEQVEKAAIAIGDKRGCRITHAGLKLPYTDNSAIGCAIRDARAALSAVNPYEWMPIDEPPTKPMSVVVCRANAKWHTSDGNLVASSFPVWRDTADRTETAFWNGDDWYESGTGHGLFEPFFGDFSCDPIWKPTHWMPLPPSPQEGK